MVSVEEALIAMTERAVNAEAERDERHQRVIDLEEELGHVRRKLRNSWQPAQPQREGDYL